MIENHVWLGLICIVISLVALGFLIYTLANLKALGIPPTHPRVMVESSIFLVFMAAGIYLILKS